MFFTDLAHLLLTIIFQAIIRDGPELWEMAFGKEEKKGHEGKVQH